MTEQFFDLADENRTQGTNCNPSDPTDNPPRDLIPLNDFLQLVADTPGLKKVIIVLPTGRYFEDFDTSTNEFSDASETTIRQFMSRLLTDQRVVDGDVEIVGLEIGNEWYDDLGEPNTRFSWTADEFGAFSAEYVRVVQNRIDHVNDQNTDWPNRIDPPIFIQAGQKNSTPQPYWSSSTKMKPRLWKASFSICMMGTGMVMPSMQATSNAGSD